MIKIKLFSFLIYAEIIKPQMVGRFLFGRGVVRLFEMSVNLSCRKGRKVVMTGRIAIS